MIKPKKLKEGDKVATISLSWGGAGEIPSRYEIGKRQIYESFGLEVFETKNALKSAKWIYENPKARAEDLMEALEDDSIKAIISNIGGDDSIRILPFIDFDVIKRNPKIFIGFSDSTVAHFCFYKAGVTSFYGTSTLVGFAENNGMHNYQISDIKNTLFSNGVRNEIKPNIEGWTSERLEWNNPKNQNISRQLTKSNGWNFLQGSKIVSGELLGGCFDVLETLKDTKLWVSPSEWQGKIMFLETSEATMLPHYFLWILRNYVASGIMHNINGLIVGRPYDNKYIKEYENALIQVIRNEAGLTDLPIITEMDFGHTCPTFTIPYGIKAEIDPINKTFSIVENALEN
ncbi:S66 family peptidase [Tenacibaculum ovolyticum]|uniref:S66 family peptidase n=1 Tax=Tenacibaculum ovolyticum TaxID=104270 RepID=UPI001F34A117|nr:S66 peptidase family protein [Tenacibaculum ovolyticum]